VGGSVTGSTCGLPSFGESICQEPGRPDAWVYVDAAPGTTFGVTATSGYSIMTFLHCDSTQTLQCMFGGGAPNTVPFVPMDPTVRLFEVEREDASCGMFTFSVIAQ
jgi:hypothetical protein